MHIYPLAQADWAEHDVDDARLAALQQLAHVHVLFVGRVARNKRQDRVMETFDQYWRCINRHSSLWLVGNDTNDPDYRAELARLHASLASGDHIHFTGKVPDDTLRAFYRGCHVFLCASEHEGFCMPIAQAMAAGLPVIALAAGAVPETLGGAGLLVHTWDTPRVAELLHLVTDPHSAWRSRVIADQRGVIHRFSKEEAARRLTAAVAWLQTGAMTDCVVTLMPTHAHDATVAMSERPHASIT
jgi:glycosyltransferase involved in cell wall biosynthesis